MQRALVAAVLMALGASTAGAATQAPPREADLGQKRSIAPDAALGGTLEAARPRAKDAGGPALAFETFRKTIEIQVSDKRREEIASLRKLIDLGGGSQAEMPQWYYRLAELLWEESQYFFFQANRRDDQLIALGKGNPAEAARLKSEKADLEDQSRKLQVQAVALYKAIIAKYPKYPRLDEVLYFLAENLSQRDRFDPEALKAYRALIERYPSSRYVPDAWMAFGEYYFEKANKSDRTGNLTKALDAYKKAAEYQESSVYAYALYKQAWVHYNLGAYDQSLELFRAVIYFGELPTSTVPADKKLALVKEARKDYVRTYSHIGSAEGAAEEFRRVGGEKGWWEMLRSLADLYYGDGKDRDAILVYARLIREKPLAPEAPYYQSRIVTSAGRMGRKEAAVQQAHVFVKMLRDIEASPVAKDEHGKKMLADARRDAEQTLRVLAVQYHNEWKKTRDEPVAGFAAAVYRDYLDVFPNEPTAYEMRFFHAELRYALADFEGAGAEYEAVALQDVKAVRAKPPGKPGKFFKDALENAVFAWDLVAKKLDETEKRVPTDPRKRLPLAPARQKLLASCERYLEYQPKGEKWVEIAYKAANIHYRHNAFAEATDLFTRIALDHPSHELAGYSTNLVLDAYNLLGDWRNVNGWAKRFYANAALVKAHPALKDDLARVIEQSAFKIIEEREKARDYEAAAEEYIAFSRDWPQSRLAPTALYNASVDYGRAHRLDRAMEVREQFLARYPGHELAPKSLYDNAEAFEAIADFSRAADLYERYFREWKRGAEPRPRGKKGKAPAAEATARWEEKKANDAIINAAVIRAGLREWARAEAASQAYLETWPRGADAPRIFLSLADLYGRRGQPSKELKQLQEYRGRYAKDPDEWLAITQRIAALYEKARSARLARDTYAEALGYWKRNRSRVKERGLPVVAQAMYLDLEQDFEEYGRITLNVAPKQLKAQLQVKGRKLKQLEERYGQVVKLKQAEPAICALYKIGLGYKHFAQTLFAAPIPREIRGQRELVEEYKAQLAQFAEPLEQKAVEGLELAMNASRDYGVVNDCAKQATAILVKYKPDEYGPSPEALPRIAQPELRDAPHGHGILAQLQPAAAPAPRQVRHAEPALPPLRVTPAAQRGDPRAAPADPQRRVVEEAPLPSRKDRQKADEEDEDLLP
ncbi:tetratricopeptide repeat protein [Anaeromyxobacter sp. Fw109-5]|uniref:tetratricopeptide repeat protein n=1 Tax=Anaeromyxobacter sp. (strain Fw109-5) TaxID=404589 RepID=UPI0000ED7030|nr:tetratricopeptide repeat protein [Anaeromyxobacter sp. Fw109-5]ABS27570.1 TPR repeat-containing protein [Anaeromyxobacter sp. Fw109-5]